MIDYMCSITITRGTSESLPCHKLRKHNLRTIIKIQVCHVRTDLVIREWKI